MSTSIFFTLIKKAFSDPRFRARLFRNPGEIVTSYGLARGEEALQNAFEPGKLETIVGRMLKHKLSHHQVSDRFMVLAPSEPSKFDGTLIPIRIDQWSLGVSVSEDGWPEGGGRAFGSGLHASTSLCLKALEDHFQGKPHVLDLGTGTGILAIAAAKLGAKSVLAIDIDYAAVQIAKSNVIINEVASIITVEYISIDQLEGLRFDLALANLTRSAHLSLLEEGMLDLLAPEGKFVLSGIMDSEGDDIRRAVRAAGGLVLDGYAGRGWVSFVVARSDGALRLI